MKLQAAIRGHLVRKQAVGTLRCVQAIVKMQILVRARRARLALQEKSDGIHGIDNYASKPLVKIPNLDLLSCSFSLFFLITK